MEFCLLYYTICFRLLIPTLRALDSHVVILPAFAPLISVTSVMDMSDPLHWASLRPLDGTPRQRQYSQRNHLDRLC